MAAGSGAASGHGARSSTAALESSLDRRFQGVSNTMESIQGLSTWCIENKKHHGLIVRYWIKWLKKSDNNHRLNLFFLANDVIQNCKRKNAIVFRSAFAEVLPNAAQLIKDGKVRKSVERIFSIWEERSVYPEEVIAQFKASLNKKEKEREKQKEKEKEKESPSANAPANTKAALKSKIVAEFTPQSLIEQLSKYKRAVAEEEFREKQLAALRVDVCSTEALKRLKDKAGGNKFAKDFEDGSLKLQEFVSFLEKQLKTGPPLLEALGNADIFYEMQYKEVKIVANAYSAFANRVASLKKKLDSLKSTLPGPEDSPIPSLSEDAPSPTDSESPFMELGASKAQVDPELDGKAMDEAELPSDNRDMEDMDMSDEEADAVTAGDEKKDKVSSAVAKTNKSDATSKLPTTATKASKTSASAAATPVTPTSTTAQSAPTTPLGVNLAKVDLGKISSILSSLTSAMKTTASPTPRPSPGTPTLPSSQATSKVLPPSPALASILSRVDITPEVILNALSKTNTSGLSSLLHSVTNTSSAPPTRTSPESSSVKTPVTPTTPKPTPTLGNNLKRDTPGRTRDWEKERQLSPPPPPPPRHSAPSASPPSLESKINSFLQGNPGFSLALGDLSPDGVDGTPVRDEAAGTPTQDEIMDTLGSVPECLGSSGGHNLSPTAYRSEPWDAVITPSGSNSDGDFLGSSSSSQYGAGKKSSSKLKDDDAMNVKKQASSYPSTDMKGKKDGQHRMMGNNRMLGERRLSSGSRKASTGSEDGGLSGKIEDKGKGQESPGRDGKEGQYHRIETLVSPCTEGAPILTLGYSNRPLAGERIKTVESIRVIGRGSRRGGGSGRPGGAMWYEEEEYMEAQPPSPHAVPPPLNIGQAVTEDMTPTMPPPHPHLLLPHLHPPPSHPHPHPPPQAQFQMPYHTENIQTPPPSLLPQHPPPTSPFFSVSPTIPPPPPPPVPQRPSPPPAHSALPSAVMVGGVLVPVDRPLSLPPPIRPEGAERGGVGLRGNKVTPPPLMTSLLGDPPKLPRPGTVKEPFVPRHAPPLHRPGAPGVPPPLLGRVKEPLNLPLPSPSPSPTSSTTSPSTPNSPAVDAAPARLPAQSAAPPLQKPSASPPAQPRSQTPVPLLNLPSPRPPILSVPIPQRPLLRGRTPSQQLNQDLRIGGFRGGKRSGPPFTGGPFQKRPFLPPRY
uniref:regulation of nuclear pre-mRNA domain-containing protein 2 isoform X2 n=1 Tax=Monopterus albus TaxID=43700 RepID=UPI0009B36C4A|nr:regulation of nuclear pre-mRNA domain-containing protein 2 isoform X2 [Monopterus albus]